MLKLILNTLFPILCVNCCKSGQILCSKCKQITKKSLAFRLDKILLKPYQANQKEILVWSCALYDHESIWAKLIKKFKYKFVKGLELFFCEQLYDLLWLKAPHIFADKNTAIVAVPSSRLRKNWRGYNQSELLAKGLSKLLDLQYLPCLSKINTEAQATLSGKSRRRNLENVFRVRDAIPKSIKRIILVDDVATTGSTLKAVCLAIENQNPQIEFYACCLASRLIF